MAAGFFRKVKNGLRKFGIFGAKLLQSDLVKNLNNKIFNGLGDMYNKAGGTLEKILTQNHF